MKQILLLAIFLNGAFFINAQQAGKIMYKETIKFEFEMDVPEGVDLSGMLPESQTFYKKLVFDQDQAIYKTSNTNEDTEQEFNSEDGSIQIKIDTGNADESFFTDLKEKKTVHQRDLMGKQFLVEDVIEKGNWKLTGEKLKYLGYECQKAVSTSEKGETIAWFTTQIPVQHGPSGFNSLPGVILMVTTPDQTLEIKATEIELGNEFNEEIKMPKKGKKVTNKEFEKISEEKIKEMKEMMGGQGIFIGN